VRVEVNFTGGASGAERATIQVAAVLKALGVTADTTASQLKDVKITAGQATETAANARRMQGSVSGIGREARQARRDLDQLKLSLAGTGPLAGILPGGARSRTGGYAALGLLGLAGAGPAGAGAAAGLAALPGLATAGAAAIGVLVGAFNGLGKAIEGDKQAFDKLNPATQQFVQTLRSLSPWLHEVQDITRQGLFPGLTDALHSALTPANAAAFEHAASGVALALGDVADEFGKSIGSPAFTAGFGQVMTQAATNLRTLGDAGLHFAAALGKLTVTAGPLTEWMSREVDLGARLLDSWTGQAQASGQLAHGLEGAKNELIIVGHFVTAFADAAYQLIRALTPLGNEILVGLTHELHNLADWVDRNRQEIIDFTTGALHDVEGAAHLVEGAFHLLSDAIGGTRHAFELLTAAFAAWKVTGILANLGLIGASAGEAGAAGKVGVLLARLNALKVLGPIAVTVVVSELFKKLGMGDALSLGDATASDSFVYIRGKQYVKGSPGEAAARHPYGPSFGESTTMTKGVTGPITTGLKAIETLTGARVLDDFATTGHAGQPGGKPSASGKTSYHGFGQAADLAPDPSVWAKLYANRGAFAELFGPWGLYHYGVQFYDAALQKDHETHIHVAYTGGPQAITKMLSGGGGGASAFGPPPPLTSKGTVAVPTEFLSLKQRTAIALAATTPGSADDLKAVQDAVSYLQKTLGQHKGEELINAAQELAGLQSTLTGLRPKFRTKLPLQLGATPASAGSLISARGLAASTLSLLSSDPSVVAPAQTAAQAEKHLADLKAKLGPEIREIGQILAGNLITSEQRATLVAQLIQYKKTITTGLDAVKTAIAAQKQGFQQAFQALGQNAISALQDEASKWKSPSQLLIDQLTSGHDDQALQDQLAAAQQSLADALVGKPDDSAILDNIKAILGRQNLANTIDRVQSAILGGMHQEISGDALLAQLTAAVTGTGGTTPDKTAVATAEKAVADAKYQIQIAGLTKQAQAETAAHDDELAANILHIQKLEDAWGFYFTQLKGNIGGIRDFWVSTLNAMGLPGVAAAVSGGTDEETAAAAGLPIINGVQWTYADEAAAQAVQLAQVNALQSAYGPKGAPQLHAAGGTFLARRPTFLTPRDVVGEAGPELVRIGDDAAGIGDIHVYIGGEKIDERVDYRIVRSTPQTSRSLGARTSRRQRANRV
jgi:hypothetical protein